MAYIEGLDRRQAALLPASLEESVPGDAPVRVIDGFVDRLDLGALGFSGMAATGRPGYAPGDILKLLIWGYMNGVCASRRLERECARNVLWLLRRLAPDFKTIADFRRANLAAIVGAAAAFVTFCREAGLLSRTAALDGTKLRAAASATRIMTQEKIAAERARNAATQARIAAFLDAMEAADRAEEAAGEDKSDIAAALARFAALAARGETLDALAQTLDDSGRASLVDGKARVLPAGHINASASASKTKRSASKPPCVLAAGATGAATTMPAASSAAACAPLE